MRFSVPITGVGRRFTIAMKNTRSMALAMSGVTPADVTALLRVLAVVVLKIRGAKATPFLPMIEKNMDSAGTVLEGVGADLSLFGAILENIRQTAATKEAAKAFVADFRKAFKAARADADQETFKVDQVNMLQTLFTLLNTPDSAGAYKSLQSKISALQAPELTQAFAGATSEKLGDIKTLEAKVMALGKQLTGTPTKTLTVKQRATAREKKPETLKEFNDAIAQLRLREQSETRTIVGAAPKGLMSLKNLFAAYAKKGLKAPYHKAFAKANHVYVNAEGQLCDKFGSVIGLAGNAGTSENNILHENAEYDPKTKGKSWLFRFLDPKQKQNEGKPLTPDNFKQIGQRFYAGSTTAGNKGAFFEKVADTVANIDKMKAKWRKTLMKKAALDDQALMHATICELMYWSGLRVGSKAMGGKTGDVSTYGATNFLAGHVKKLAANKVQLAFPVKGGHGISKFILDPADADDAEDKKHFIRMNAIIAAKAAEKENKKERVFDGVNTDRLNAYIKSLGSKITAKGFRTMLGTEVAKKSLDAATAKLAALTKKGQPADREVYKLFNDAMLEVGKKLAHIRGDDPTAVTAIKYYVTPALMVDWFNKAKVKIPPQVAAAAKQGNVSV